MPNKKMYEHPNEKIHDHSATCPFERTYISSTAARPSIFPNSYPKIKICPRLVTPLKKRIWVTT